MPLAEIKGEKVTAKLWLPIHEIESGALDQIRNVASLPWTEAVAIMPDVHLGVGATIGTVLVTKEAVVPSVVGVDPGCGLLAVQTGLIRGELPRKLGELREEIEAAIPVGFMSHGETHELAKKGYAHLLSNAMSGSPALAKIASGTKFMQQLGTLGGGNHHSEVSYDENGRVWVTLHSGSRNFGKCVAEYYIHEAKKQGQIIPDRNLSAFMVGSTGCADYLYAMRVCREYAQANRDIMMEIILRILEARFGVLDRLQTISCVHNYIAEETHHGEKCFVTRKGAIRAQKDELSIIPAAMGNGVAGYITRGLGNEEAFNSAPHGAGRAMSRGAAKRKFTLDDLRATTSGVECRKDKSVLDEIQGAYKPIETVMKYASDLVTPEHELHALLCVKG